MNSQSTPKKWKDWVNHCENEVKEIEGQKCDIEIINGFQTDSLKTSIKYNSWF